MSVLDDSIRSIEQLAAEITDTAGQLPEKMIRWKPAPEAWSIQEILSHVEEAAPYWAAEMQSVAASPGAEWGRNHHNEARLAAVAGSSQRSAQDLITGVANATAATVAILRGLKDGDLQVESPSRNPRWGTKPMSFVLDHLIVSHLRGHLEQIRRNVEQFAALRE